MRGLEILSQLISFTALTFQGVDFAAAVIFTHSETSDQRFREQQLRWNDHGDGFQAWSCDVVLS